MSNFKQVIIIAGPNGAGKTTFAKDFLPQEGKMVNFINADLIALGLSPFAPETVSVQASKILLARIDECCRRHESFGVETTLSGRVYIKKILDWQKQGYVVTLHFLKLASVDLAVERVNMRVKHGGHYIPIDVIKRRYDRGLKLLPLYKNIVNEWKIWDTSQGKPELIDER